MKIITYLAAFSLSAIVLTSTSSAKAPAGWETDVEAALAIAKKEKKSVMLEFASSDSCPQCAIMSKNVFSKKEFFKAASKDFVLVYLDFPDGDKELYEKNDPFALKYNIDGFPMIVLTDSDGKEFGKFLASDYPTVETYLAKLKKALEYKDLD